MTKDKKSYLLLLIIMFIFTGCQNPLSSSFSKSSQTANSQNTVSKTFNTNSNSSAASAGANFTVTTGAVVNPCNAGNTVTTFNINNNTKVSLNIKATCFDSDGSNIYYEDYLNKYALSGIKVDGSGFVKLKDDAPTSIASGSGVVYYSNGWNR